MHASEIVRQTSHDSNNFDKVSEWHVNEDDRSNYRVDGENKTQTTNPSLYFLLPCCPMEVKVLVNIHDQKHNEMVVLQEVTGEIQQIQYVEHEYVIVLGQPKRRAIDR